MAHVMRMLGLDVGERRIGMAISDPFGFTAQGAGFIERGSQERTLSLLREVVGRYNIGQIVMGFPLMMSGEEGESARNVRVFSEQIQRSLKIPVVLWDERLTTAEADKLMKTAGLSRKKRSKHIDEMAAQIILQSYLDSR
ncbi:MAG: Holliday junction resolvase RuvX [Candidatus Aureabacteria bacterium]|nr:Holliday junction resolvase RuvX [Candidatus Auribacterota bacterium]